MNWRILLISIGSVFILTGPFLLMFWDFRALLGLMLLIFGPILLLLGLVKTKETNTRPTYRVEKKSSPV
ncbi:MAG: hypothetical protein OEL81_05210 [Nitrosopumilus sp.]|nr:hypothetical protein [Nitrosopumilus sp.]MDH3385795.1 hypothetical protein [Nitrosopumilus sp.]